MNHEKRPDTETDSKELEQLYEVIRQVRTLKEPAMPDQDFVHRIVRGIKGKKSTQVKNRKRIWNGGLASIAAILVLMIMINFITPLNNKNIVYAMEKAFHEVKAYHGVLETVSVNELGEETIQSKLVQ